MKNIFVLTTALFLALNINAQDLRLSPKVYKKVKSELTANKSLRTIAKKEKLSKETTISTVKEISAFMALTLNSQYEYMMVAIDDTVAKGKLSTQEGQSLKKFYQSGKENNVSGMLTALRKMSTQPSNSAIIQTYQASITGSINNYDYQTIDLFFQELDDMIANAGNPVELYNEIEDPMSAILNNDLLDGLSGINLLEPHPLAKLFDQRTNAAGGVGENLRNINKGLFTLYFGLGGAIIGGTFGGSSGAAGGFIAGAKAGETASETLIEGGKLVEKVIFGSDFIDPCFQSPNPEDCIPFGSTLDKY